MADMSLEESNPTRSTSFRESDADITFKSSDHVLFGIHRKNLQTSTGVFPPAEFSPDGEVVQLSEDAETLEILFQFVYPRRHPTLLETPFLILAKVSEAAEKYQVFAAMNICNIRMEQALPRFPVEVLNYAAKHGYPNLVEAAVPCLLDMPMEIVVQKLSDSLVVPWVVFRQRWSNVVLKFVRTPIEGTNFQGQNGSKSCRYGCVHGGGLIGDIWQILDERRSLNAVIGAYAMLKPPCAHITINTVELRAKLSAELGAIPAFSP
ncbi:hypothetical protein H2248_011206 [Termitomyces sp. 'cryptogamus']|nr:hypothetical protein H2248_011206 [Termitomyces sp. 'cryptogamus']